MEPGDESSAARVLIVDDQPLTRELMTLVVHAQGHKTLMATSGEERSEERRVGKECRL